MKRFILSLFIFLCGGLAALFAQERIVSGPRIIARAGAIHHTGDPSGGIPYTSVAIGADIPLPVGTLGFIYDLPGGQRKTQVVELRYGYASQKGRFRFGGFLTGRHLWEADGFRQVFIGVNITADWRIAGPFGIFVSGAVAYPLMRSGSYTFTPWTGQGMLSYGLSLHF